MDLPERLSARLRMPLPGWSAQAAFQPEMSFGRHLGPAPPNARAAAVLALLYPSHDQWHVPFIRRPADMPFHPGQVSLPGGLIEPGEDSRQAALREYGEELGGPAGDVRVLGQLTPLYLFASNHLIAPWVGVLDAEPRWMPNQREVDCILEIPLEHLADPASIGSIQRSHGELFFSAPCFHWRSDPIWGATSMILAELMSAVGDCAL
jgi:8-oxo-dGTP pyrophosphatase MutT (NUDIX family)